MNIRSLALAASLAIVTATAGAAATFTVGGVAYDIEVVLGRYNDLQSEVQASAWWGDETLTYQVANAVGDGLGLVSTDRGPFFASGPSAKYAGIISGLTWKLATGTSSADPYGKTSTAYYAIGTGTTIVPTVPLPAAGLLLLSGLGGIAAFKSRKKRAA